MILNTKIGVAWINISITKKNNWLGCLSGLSECQATTYNHNQYKTNGAQYLLGRKTFKRCRNETASFGKNQNVFLVDFTYIYKQKNHMWVPVHGAVKLEEVKEACDASKFRSRCPPQGPLTTKVSSNTAEQQHSKFLVIKEKLKASPFGHDQPCAHCAEPLILPPKRRLSYGSPVIFKPCWPNMCWSENLNRFSLDLHIYSRGNDAWFPWPNNHNEVFPRCTQIPL